MINWNQLIKKNSSRFSKKSRVRAPAFDKAPHRKGVIYKIATMAPRKPNSARRTYAKVRLNFNDRRVFAKIPGIGEVNYKLIL